MPPGSPAKQPPTPGPAQGPGAQDGEVDEEGFPIPRKIPEFLGGGPPGGQMTME